MAEALLGQAAWFVGGLLLVGACIADHHPFRLALRRIVALLGFQGRSTSSGAGLSGFSARGRPPSSPAHFPLLF